MKTRLLSCLALTVATLAACSPGGDRQEPASERPPTAVAEASRLLLPNGRQPDEGLLSGGQPDAAQLRALRDAGFRTVVNLRAADEPGARAAQVEALGMDYVELPIGGADGLTEDNARAFAEILDRIERPAVVHCASGNRVGALFALKAFYVDGATVDEAFATGERSGLTRLAGAVRQHLEAAGGQPASADG